MARVRPDLDALWHLLVGAEATTGGLQRPRSRSRRCPFAAGDRWAALPFDDEDDRPTGVGRRRSSSTRRAVRLADPVGVLDVDTWTEQIPVAVETAGLAFHYDAPSNRAPQVAMLAVPPEVDRPPLEPRRARRRSRESFDLATSAASASTICPRSARCSQRSTCRSTPAATSPRSTSTGWQTHSARHLVLGKD